MIPNDPERLTSIDHLTVPREMPRMGETPIVIVKRIGPPTKFLTVQEWRAAFAGLLAAAGLDRPQG